MCFFDLVIKSLIAGISGSLVLSLVQEQLTKQRDCGGDYKALVEYFIPIIVYSMRCVFCSIHSM